MARTCTDEKLEETRLICHNDDKEDDEEEDKEEEEEEALSLCDLAINLTKEDTEFHPRSEEYSRNEESFSFEFNLNSGSSSSSSRVAPDSSEPAEMSTADELFFKGRILPLRHSMSSDTGFNRLICNPTRRDPTLFLPRSGSVDLRRTGSIASSRSSSSGSGPRIKNNFINYSHPSPQPQIRRTSSLESRVSVSRKNPKNTIWEFLRLGLVRAPEIELQDIKLRNAQNCNNNRVSVSRNSSSCSSTATSNSSGKNSNKIAKNTKTKEQESRQRKQQHGSAVSNRKRRFLLGDCRCSVDTAETVPLNNSVSVVALEEKLRDLQIKKKQKKTKEQKQALSRYRTFEWLKELSQSSSVDH